MRNLHLAVRRSGAQLLLLASLMMVANPLGHSQTPAPPQQPRGGNSWVDHQKSQAWATEKLENSPRRKEWVTIPDGNRSLKARIIYPAAKGKVPVVIVVHEVFGLTDSTINTADEIAAMGYITISPDMLSGLGPNGGGVSSFDGITPGASVTLTTLKDSVVNSAFDALGDYADKLPQSNGKFAIVGLSWGGGAAFRYVTSTQRKDLKTVCVFYDVGPPAETQKGADISTISVDKISVPVYGFYGETDKRPLVTIQATKDAMAAAGKKYDPVVYPGADHAFMRVGEDPNDKNTANPAAVEASLGRLRKILADNLK